MGQIRVACLYSLATGNISDHCSSLKPTGNVDVNFVGVRREHHQLLIPIHDKQLTNSSFWE